VTQALALVAVLSLGGLAAQGAVPKELAPLQGSWVLKSVGGEELAAGGVNGDITITGNKYVVTINGVVDEEGTLQVDASKKPMTIDLLIAKGPRDTSGKRQLGIAEVTPGMMRFHLAVPGATSRPTNFDPIPNHDVIVVTKKK
jgi:uncharacterized protein (TIGR03067 family)